MKWGKTKRRTVLIGLVTTLVISSLFVFGGCGKSSSNNKNSNASGASSLQKKLDINEFEWSVGQTKKNGKDIYAFSLTNNSKYELLAVDIKYKTKNGLTQEQLAVFDSFLQKHSTYVKDGQTTADVNMQGKKEVYLAPKDMVENIPVALGIGDSYWYDSPTTQQFELMEPSELQLAVVDGDTLYFAYYDFPSQTWKMDSKTVELNNWPSNEVGKKVPKLDGHVFKSDSYDVLNKIKIDVYNVTTDEFNEYINKLKESGFTEEIKEKEYSSILEWEAKDKEGNFVELDYDKENRKLNIVITGKTDDKAK